MILSVSSHNLYTIYNKNTQLSALRPCTDKPQMRYTGNKQDQIKQTNKCKYIISLTVKTREKPAAKAD